MAKAERRAPLEKPHSPFFETIYAVRGGSARGSLPRPRGMLSQDYCCGEPSGGTNPDQQTPQLSLQPFRISSLFQRTCGQLAAGKPTALVLWILGTGTCM